MATAKIQSFTDAEVRLAAWAKALGHPARIAILNVLAQRQTCICGEIVDELPLAQATVSQHLKALKEAGLVQGDVEGPRVCYCLNHETLRQLEAAFGGLFDDLKPASSCC